MTVPDTLQAARELAPEIRAAAAEGDRLRTMPPALAATLEDAGLFALWLPRALGGLELDPATIVRVIEEVSHADGAAGWTTLIGTSSAFLAWVEPDAARELLGDRPLAASSCVVATSGTATPDGDGFTVSGRWGFNSGVRHSRISQVGAVVMDGGSPRMLPTGVPDWRFAFLPTDRAQVVETWESPGLRGTGSHDVVVDGVRVPEELCVLPGSPEPRHDGPLWRFPLFANLNVTIVGFPLGGRPARARRVHRTGAGEERGGALIAEDRHVQLELARAEGGLQSARAFVFDVIGELWGTACGGDPLSLDQQARLSLAAQQATRAAVDAVDAVYRLAGAGVARNADHPLARCFRDLHTVDAHPFVSADAVAKYAKHRLGVEQPAFLL